MNAIQQMGYGPQQEIEMTIPFHIFPQIPPMIADDFRGDDFWERHQAGEEYRANCLEAPECIPSGSCKKAKSEKYASADWNFR